MSLRRARFPACGHLPGKDQTQQRADEDEHLVEHGRVGPLDGAVEVVLPARWGERRQTNRGSVWPRSFQTRRRRLLCGTEVPFPPPPIERATVALCERLLPRMLSHTLSAASPCASDSTICSPRRALARSERTHVDTHTHTNTDTTAAESPLIAFEFPCLSLSQ